MRIVQLGFTELESPHLKGILRHFFPPVRGTIQELETQLATHNLVLPTFSEKISIDFDAYVGDKDNHHSLQLRQLDNKGTGYVRTAVLYDRDGMYAVDLDFVSGLNLADINVLKAGLNGEKIEKVQLSRDRKSAFAPCETIIYGEQKPKDLARNGGVIALARDMSQVEKSVELAEQFKYASFFHALKIKGGIQRNFVRLDSDWDGYRLDVYCDCHGGGAGGFASGVKRTGEASSQNYSEK